jgi:hypothetical protein
MLDSDKRDRCSMHDRFVRKSSDTAGPFRADSARSRLRNEFHADALPDSPSRGGTAGKHLGSARGQTAGGPGWGFLPSLENPQQSMTQQ